MKFSLDALYHLDDIFLLIKDVSFSSLRKLTYECPRGVDNTITARRLRGLFAASKINHLVLNIHRLDPLASVLPEIGSIGGSLQHLEVNRMTVQEALELQLSCPHLISLVIAIFDFDAEVCGFCRIPCFSSMLTFSEYLPSFQRFLSAPALILVRGCSQAGCILFRDD